ncbi:MAG: hypothetical protein ACW7DR_08870, partial [Paraglaciecola chathamensis]
EYRPVTPGVASSSLVRSAINFYLYIIFILFYVILASSWQIFETTYLFLSLAMWLKFMSLVCASGKLLALNFSVQIAKYLH